MAMTRAEHGLSASYIIIIMRQASQTFLLLYNFHFYTHTNNFVDI